MLLEDDWAGGRPKRFLLRVSVLRNWYDVLACQVCSVSGLCARMTLRSPRALERAVSSTRRTFFFQRQGAHGLKGTNNDSRKTKPRGHEDGERERKADRRHLAFLPQEKHRGTGMFLWSDDCFFRRDTERPMTHGLHAPGSQTND